MLKYNWDFKNPPIPEGEAWDESRDFFLAGGGVSNEEAAKTYNKRTGKNEEEEDA